MTMQAKWELQELKTIQADPQVLLARFTPCGKYLLAASYDARVRRWDVAGDEPVELEAIGGHGGWVTAIASSAAGEWLFSGDSWGRLRCGAYGGPTAAAAKWTLEAAHDGWLRDIAVSPDGKRAATCGIDKRVRIWSAEDGAKQLDFAVGEGPEFEPRNGSLDGDVACLRFTADGQGLITADLKGQIRIWDLQGPPRVVRSFDAGSLFKLDRLQDVGGVRCLTVDGESKWLAAGGTAPKNGGTVVGIPTALLFDYATGELKQTFTYGQPNDCFVSDLAFHPRGYLLATTNGTPGSGQLIVQPLSETQPLFVTKKMVNCQSVAVHPDGARLAVAATNAGSNGNGRPLTKDGAYATNKSPIVLWKLPTVS